METLRIPKKSTRSRHPSTQRKKSQKPDRSSNVSKNRLLKMLRGNRNPAQSRNRKFTANLGAFSSKRIPQLTKEDFFSRKPFKAGGKNKPQNLVSLNMISQRNM